MKLWSKGLGRQILPFNLREATSVEEEGESILIQGRIIEKKVNWPYKLYLDVDDMVNFTALMAENHLILSYLKEVYGWRFVFFLLKRLTLLPFVVLRVFLVDFLFKRRSSPGGEVKNKGG